MANVKAEGTTRKQKLVMLSPDNLDYLREKGKLFERGGRGGESEALNRMIEFVRGYEKRMGGK
jgi:hypothetical protein